ncbi:hypothetical protein C8035_v001901 [Colletotrichum spinosum]|uniref:Azaphilone pigments biosynthesis cluster protein L N-terminal domain-containing protein n=1 Tax=Colletotrichum spinosum TaxID=1347390 RepID=A0A4V3HRB5_9PEZI|nr:hypothetical protein C8035_v001901 [Colletotrichum spinosum]
MDPVSLSLAIAGLLPVLGKAIKQVQALYSNVNRAKESIKQLMDELNALQGNLSSLNDLLESDAVKAEGIKFDKSSVLMSCSVACNVNLESLCKTLEKYAGSRTWRTAWPVLEKECKDSLQTLRNFAFWIQLALSVARTPFWKIRANGRTDANSFAGSPSLTTRKDMPRQKSPEPRTPANGF